MTAATPHDLPQLFRAAFASNNPDAVAALYEPDGRVVANLAAPVIGRAAIRAMVAQFMDQRPQFSLEATEVIESGDLALVRSRWTITMPSSAGATSQMQVQPSLVTRRQPGNHWLVVIDCPNPPGQ